MLVQTDVGLMPRQTGRGHCRRRAARLGEWTRRGTLSCHADASLQANAYPKLNKWLLASINKVGEPHFLKARESCFYSVVASSLGKDVLGLVAAADSKKSEGYFNVSDVLGAPECRDVMKHNLLGAHPTQIPVAPLFIVQSLHDEIVPFAPVDDLVQRWGRAGARIEYIRDEWSAHVILCFTGYPVTVKWMEERLELKPNPVLPGKPYVRTVKTSLNDEPAKACRESPPPPPSSRRWLFVAPRTHPDLCDRSRLPSGPAAEADGQRLPEAQQ
jgi:hypothetical protein